MDSEGSKRSLFEELRRRHVWRVATIYAAAAFVVWQVADIALPALGLPDTVMTWVVVLALAGFPIAIGLAWVFELTSQGVKRTSRLDALEDAGAARPPSVRRRAALVATVSLVVLAGTALVVDRLALFEGDPELSHTALAVLPFQVRGAESLGYLREGMVDLLSRSMDGVGDLKSVDPVRVTLLASSDAPLDTNAGESVARSVGAGQFVMGSVNESAGTVRINASLYALQDSLVALSNSEVQGDTTELFSLVDRLTGELLAGRPLGAASQSVVRSAAVSTTSLSALKDFLDGERLLREARFDSASAAFTRAVERDSSFGTAYYRRAVSMGFRGRYDDALASVDQALGRTSGMREHDRQLAEAYGSYMRGQLDEATGRYRQILRAYPEDLEAKVHLAQVLMRRNPDRGDPLTEARELLTSVLEVDPKYQCSLCALQNLAASAHDWEALRHYLRLAHARDQDGDSTLHLDERIFLARAMERTAELNSLLTAVDTVTDEGRLHGLHDTGHMVQAYFGDIPLFARLERSSRPADSSYPEWDHAWEELYLERTMGHMVRSLEYVRELGRLDYDDHIPLLQRQMPYLVYVDPDLSLPRDQLEEAREYLDGLPPGALHNDTEAQRIIAEALWDPLRRHYLGLVRSRLGLLDEAEADARALDEQSMGFPEYAGVLDVWARTIRADIAYREGKFDRVIELVEREALPIPLGLGNQARVNQSKTYAQLLLTDALIAVGRYREALRWLRYGRYVDNGLSYAFQAERMGQAYEAVGDLEAAAAAYARFTEAWADADPELQPRVEAARQRIEEILARIG